jgi:antitoxin ParD1/3/4
MTIREDGHERTLESWLREEVAAAYDAMKADPSQAIPLDKVLASLADAHKKPKPRRGARK